MECDSPPECHKKDYWKFVELDYWGDDTGMIVDFKEIKIRQLIDSAQNEMEFEVATALLSMYLEQMVEVTLEEGELLFQIKNIESNQLELPLEKII